MTRTARFFLLVAFAVLLVAGLVQSRPQGKLSMKDCMLDVNSCGLDSQIICGIDEKGAFRTFNNICDMEYTNCVLTNYYSIFMTGPCL